jgi:lipoprotein-releasing system ATP-binding protein
MIKATGITKSYGELKVLKGIDIEVKSGEIVAIVGASGAGKSTLLHILGTLDYPDSGEAWLGETNLLKIKGNKLAQFRNKHIGFVFQFHNLLPEFNALENVCMPAFLAGVNVKEAEVKAYILLKRLGIDARAKHRPSEMSGGEQQRTAIARALMNDPEVVFADEPSGNLDSKNSEELHKLFFELREEFGQTFIIVTHNKELAAMSDRRIEMQDGFLI